MSSCRARTGFADKCPAVARLLVTAVGCVALTGWQPATAARETHARAPGVPRISGGQLPRSNRDTMTLEVRLPDPDSPDAVRLRMRASVIVKVPSPSSSEPIAGVRGLARTDDGGFLLAEASRSRLQRFSARGMPTGATGRAGAGPGEFTAMLAMARCGDQEVVVQDPALNRVSFFRTDPRYVAVAALPAGYNSDQLLGCSARRRLIVLDHQPKSIPAEKGLVRTRAALVLASGPSEVDTILAMPGTDFVFARRVPGYVDLPLSQRALAAVGRSIIAAGSSSNGRIAIFDLSGRELRRLHFLTPRRRLTAGEVQDAYRERVSVEFSRTTQQLLTAVLQEAPASAQLPMIEDLRVDLDDRLWIRAYPRENSATAPWYVVTATGELKGVLQLPRRFVPFEIGRNYLLGVDHDADGVEAVQLMSLGKDLPPLQEIRP